MKQDSYTATARDKIICWSGENRLNAVIDFEKKKQAEQIFEELDNSIDVHETYADMGQIMFATYKQIKNKYTEVDKNGD